MKIVHANILLFFYSLLHIQMDTLCYLTPSTDGDHAPECLLESCIYMETANTIGQMLQQNKDKIVIEKKQVTSPVWDAYTQAGFSRCVVIVIIKKGVVTTLYIP